MIPHLKNHLAEQSSLYLRQHADDPVDWYPWGEEALGLAREQNKPIFLSIGYSACHWCHVMAEESFQDEQTARWMNQYFICIKVDAQERPDLDKVYQTAYQLMHQQPGGWPLTAILTPEQQLPFFIGTYFPKVSMAGIPSFLDVITQVTHYYQQHSSTLEQHQAPLLTAFSILNETMRQPTIDSMNDKPLTIARIEWEGDYDEGYAGFGSSPKFPHPSFLNGLMYYWYLTKAQSEEDPNALRMISTTLDKMASSGLYDHIGGGFFRYAIDAAWQIPHFEKMLYDNAQLLTLYVQAYQSIVDPVFKRVGQEVAAWLLAECQSPEGGFYATWDADTEDGEGAYYVWQRSEIQNILTVEEYTIIENYWGLTKPANFEGDWHLQNGSAVIELAVEYKESIQSIEKTIESARLKLLAKRQKRSAPICDKKILMSWNALTVKALCHSAMVFENEEYQWAAEKTLQFIYKNMWIDGRLYTAYEAGRCATKAYLEDYAHLLDALLRYCQLQWHSEYFDWAITLANQLLDLFEDEEQGGFYFTGNDQEILLFRPKPFAEDSTPSGNGIAAQCLLVLGYLLGDVRYLTAAERTLRVSDYHLHHQAEIHGSLLIALDYYLRPPEVIILRGDGAEMSLWKDLSQKGYNPRRFVFAIPQDAEGLPAALQRKMPDKKAMAAYICDGIQCSKPILDFNSYKEKIKIL